MALLTPQTVGLIIRNLERDGAIRKMPHPVHGRVLQWTLTRRGETLLEQCRRHVNTVERRLAAGLGARTEAAIRRWLAKIATGLANSGHSATSWLLVRRATPLDWPDGTA